jgi:hypothetical protein
VIAALYVETNGIYYGLPNIDPWDETRDARTYAGPWPVVAHPPCKTWSLMANCRPLTASRDDGGCFAAALAAVERYGGVLEHPAHTRAWRTFNLPKPVVGGWNIALHGRPGWATQVDQGAYGHPCHKWTWLYYFGDAPPPRLDWREVHTGRKVHDDGGGGRDQRSRTPLAFRDMLISIAENAALARDGGDT